jgi:hypothetical protein
VPFGTERETLGLPAIREGRCSKKWQFSAVYDGRPQKTYVKSVSFL